MSEHSFISPSNTRVEHCAASALREDLISRRAGFLKEYSMYYITDNATQVRELVDDGSAMADLGTALHAILESLLAGETLESANTDAIEEEFLLDGLQQIADDIFKHADGAHINPEKFVANLGVDSGGTMDASYQVSTTLVIRDLKSGYIPVSAIANTQLMRYACGVMDELKWDEAIKSIELYIDAIRFPSSMWEITPAELLKWRDGAFVRFMKAGNGINPPATPGDHCLNCKAKAHCGELQGWAEDKIKYFDADFGTMEMADLEQMYLDIPVVEKLKSALKDEIMVRAKAGFSPLTLLKEKPGASNTAYAINPGMVVDAIGELSPKDIIYHNGKLKSPAKLAEVFHSNPEVLEILNTDGVDLEKALAPYVNSGLLLSEPKLVTAAKLKSIVVPDKLKGIIKVGRNKPSLIKGDKK